MTEIVDKFEQWCVVEIMGHKRFAGFVTEQALGGTSFVRVDVPEIATETGQTLFPAFSKLFGAASIYCLSPCTEETARAFAASIRSESFSKYEAPRLPAPTPLPDGAIPNPPCDGVIPKPDPDGDTDGNWDYEDGDDGDDGDLQDTGGPW